MEKTERFKVSVSEILQILNRQNEINRQDLNNIDFLDDDGNVLNIDKVNISAFGYSGLTNCDFIAGGFYKDSFV